MKRLLVTGANGFVGRWLVALARERGDHVIATALPDDTLPVEWNDDAVTVIRGDLRDARHRDAAADARPDAVIHLAAVASGAEARRDPERTAAVNTAAAVDLARAVWQTGAPRFLFVSTGEVYGAGHSGAIAESAPVEPVSPYGASKAAAETALREVAAGARMPLLIARPFPHTGPGQAAAYVIPALAARLAAARREGASTIRAGNLAAVRDFLDVRDVVAAYLQMLERGRPGETYNVASGTGRSIAECAALLQAVVGTHVTIEPDAALLRPSDIPVLIGDAGKLRDATGWRPQIPFERTLQDLVHAQTQ